LVGKELAQHPFALALAVKKCVVPARFQQCLVGEVRAP
jgi:hypothetical protein